MAEHSTPAIATSQMQRLRVAISARDRHFGALHPKITGCGVDSVFGFGATIATCHAFGFAAKVPLPSLPVRSVCPPAEASILSGVGQQPETQQPEPTKTDLTDSHI